MNTLDSRSKTTAQWKLKKIKQIIIKFECVTVSTLYDNLLSVCVCRPHRSSGPLLYDNLSRVCVSRCFDTTDPVEYQNMIIY